jgi:hypothetical protein
MRLSRLAAVTAILALSCGEAAYAAIEPTSGRKAVSYAGTTVEVPAQWPVHDLRAEPHTCIRYDRPAVYLGDPSPDQDCPASAGGRALGQDPEAVRRPDAAGSSSTGAVTTRLTAGRS